MEQTKLRLIREAVQDNVHGERRGRSQEPDRSGRSRAVPGWIWGVSLAAILACLTLLAPFTSSPDGAIEGTARVAFAATDPALSEASRLDESMNPSMSRLDGPVNALGAAPEPLDPALFPLAVKTVVIDAGHGGADTGTISAGGVREKDIVLDIALHLRRLLEEASFEVRMTRETDRWVGLEQRAEIANRNGADLFVSIHVNWMDYPEVQPLETYFLGPSDDPEATKLVAMENQDPGFSLNDYRFLLEKIYVDARRDESRRLAQAVQGELHRSLSRINPTIDDRGVKMAPFAVLTRTEMPAILAEVSSLSNETDVQLLTTAEYRESIAEALASGVRAYADRLAGSSGKVAQYGK